MRWGPTDVGAPTFLHLSDLIFETSASRSPKSRSKSTPSRVGVSPTAVSVYPSTPRWVPPIIKLLCSGLADAGATAVFERVVRIRCRECGARPKSRPMSQLRATFRVPLCSFRASVTNRVQSWEVVVVVGSVSRECPRPRVVAN